MKMQHTYFGIADRKAKFILCFLLAKTLIDFESKNSPPRRQDSHRCAAKRHKQT